jgi:GT2 family glycosyltransferase
MNLPRLGIIILHWNHADDTLRCLESIDNGRDASGYSNYQVLVVDNGSTNYSLDVLRQAHPDLEILPTGQNLGYTGGNNAGLRRLMNDPVEYFLLLNDDTIVNENTLWELAKAASEYPEAGFLGPKIMALEAPEVLLSAGGRLIDGYRPQNRGLGEPDQHQFDQDVEVDYLSGCALLVKRLVVERIGLLDDDYFAYHEEIDWCYRGRKAGFNIRIVPTARVCHPDTRRRDENSPAVTYYTTRNRLLFARKHRLGWSILIRMLTGYGRQYLSWSLRPKWRSKSRQRQALAQALLDFACRRKGKWEPWP